jgi:hypothetical protein
MSIIAFRWDVALWFQVGALTSPKVILSQRVLRSFLRGIINVSGVGIIFLAEGKLRDLLIALKM